MSARMVNMKVMFDVPSPRVVMNVAKARALLVDGKDPLDQYRDCTQSVQFCLC